MRIRYCFLALSLTLAAQAKDKPAKAQPQDEIQVVAHVALSGGPVERFLTTQHFSRSYLYAEHGSGKSVSLIDVTKAARPVVLADVDYGTDGRADTLFAVTGTAALVVGGPAASPAVPQSVRIMNFADPQHPKVAREFTGVTAITRDPARGLIFLADADGVWILSQQLAIDPEVDAAFARHVLYDH